MEQVTFVGKEYNWYRRSEDLSERRKFYDDRCGVLSHMRCYFELLERHDGELIDEDLRNKVDEALVDLIQYYESLAKRRDRSDKKT